MAYNYVVSAQKPTCVTGCLTGNFVDESEINLIIAKLNRLEIYSVTSDGLKPITEVVINGQVDKMLSFRPPNATLDQLFISTAKYDVMILECKDEGKQGGGISVVTLAHGNVKESIGRPCENGVMGDIDPSCQVVALRLYDGLLKAIPLAGANDRRELTAFNMRMEDNTILDMRFLHGWESHPVLLVLYQETHCCHLKTYKVHLQRRELVPGPWKMEDVERGSHMIISVQPPFGGALVVGEKTILYHQGDPENTIVTIAPPELKEGTVLAYAPVDRDSGVHMRFLLSNQSGHLFILMLREAQNNVQFKGTGKRPATRKPGSPVPFFNEPGSPVSIQLVTLSRNVTIAEHMTYLDNGFVFLGSRLGDSQLIELLTDATDNGEYTRIMDTFTSLAPIVDMTVVNLEGQGQGMLATCSGAFKQGSLRFIRSGIGIHESVSIDLHGIIGLWALRVSSKDYDNHLVLTFVTQTRVLNMDGEVVEELDKMGDFLMDCRTLFCSNVSHDQILQVTVQNIRLLSADSLTLKAEWRPPGGSLISASALSRADFYVCACGARLYALRIVDGELLLEGETTLPNEVACIDVCSLDGEIFFCVVALWNDLTCRLLTLAELKEIECQELGGEYIPRSILVCTFENTDYVLVGIGDGSLVYFNLSRKTGILSNRKCVTLGTHPVLLYVFKSLSTTNVFACTDRPTIIHSNSRKLIFSNVNHKDVRHVCAINAVSYPDSLAFCNYESLTVGTVDEIQKLHVSSIPLRETPRRVAYHDAAQVFGVLTIRQEVFKSDKRLEPLWPSCSTTVTSKMNCLNCNNLGEEIIPGALFDVSSFVIIDHNTAEICFAYTFQLHEQGTSLMCCSLITPNKSDTLKSSQENVSVQTDTFFVVGTSFVHPDETEPKHGKIRVFRWSGGCLRCVVEKEVTGAVYCLVEFHGKILAAINGSVTLFEWGADNQLHKEASFHNNTVALYLKVKGDFILVGDLMKNMCLVRYIVMQGNFEEIAWNHQAAWMTAVEVVDDEHFLGGENTNNLFLCQKELLQDDWQHLKDIGYYHVGDFINVFRKGSLVMQAQSDENNLKEKSILFGTCGGAIYVIQPIKKEMYSLLLKIQNKLASIIHSVGNIQHHAYRSFYNDYRKELPDRFIDGDLVESFLDIGREDMVKIIKDITVSDDEEGQREATVEDIIHIIEDFSRIH